MSATSENPNDRAVPGAAAHEITQAIRALQQGDPRASDDLLELVYAELRQLARSRLAHEPGGGAGMTLDATALVHEAYLRVIGRSEQPAPAWDGRGHFFGAAALAMRRILVERARGRRSEKRGGDPQRISLDDAGDVTDERAADLVALDEALTALAAIDPRKAQLVELRYFGGLTIEEAAVVLGVSTPTVERDWHTAKLWLLREISMGK